MSAGRPESASDETTRVGVWFAASFLTMFVASKSLGLTLGYALDDYVTLGASDGHLQGFLLSQGRFFFALIQTGMDLSGLKQPELAGFGFFLSGGALAALSWLTLSPWLVGQRFLAVAIAAFLGAHPFFAEYVSFRQALFPMGICLLLVVGAAAQYGRYRTTASTVALLTAALLAALASGINQIAMAFFCISILGIALHRNSDLEPVRRVLLTLRDVALGGGLATAFYVAITGALMAAFSVDANARMSLVGLGDASERVVQVGNLYMEIFSGRHPLVGAVAAWMTAVAALALAVRTSTSRHMWAPVPMAVFVLATATTVAVIPAALSMTWWPVPRTLVALPLALALGIVVLASHAHQTLIHAASAMLLLACVALAGKSGALLLDQQRLNRWDLELAREIVLTVGRETPLDGSVPIVIHRARWAYEIDERMPIGDANLSAMRVGWAVDALFEEATGRRLNVALGAEADVVCNGVRAFPAPGSSIVRDGTVHVCL